MNEVLERYAKVRWVAKEDSALGAFAIEIERLEAENAALKEMTRWHSPSEMPGKDVGQIVICHAPNPLLDAWFYMEWDKPDKGWEMEAWGNVIAWLPIPPYEPTAPEPPAVEAGSLAERVKALEKEARISHTDISILTRDLNGLLEDLEQLREDLEQHWHPLHALRPDRTDVPD